MSWWGYLLDDGQPADAVHRKNTVMSPAKPTASPAPLHASPVVRGGVSTCRRCLSQFERHKNNPTACRFHPESYSGETKQRWAPPGEENCGDVHFFWSCCGDGDRDSPGCCTAAHVGFDDCDSTGSFDGCFKDYGTTELQGAIKPDQD